MYGRPVLAAGEIWQMLDAEDILTAYRSRQASEKWAEWADTHPRYASLLRLAESLANAND